MNQDTRVIFMGTPDFAVPCLQALLDEGYTVPAVISQPDRPSGRGQRLKAPEVKELALLHTIPVFQPTKLKDPAFHQLLRDFKPDLIVVVAYGRMLPKAILEIPPLGCINIHGSLLPKLRGSAPIQWSIINGDTVTGVTSMYMAEGMDTGDIILQESTPIGAEETAGELFDRLAQLGAQLLIKTLPLLVAGTAPRIPQNEADATYAPMIRKDLGALDFSQNPEAVCNLICGLNPSPRAYTSLDGERLTILSAKPVEGYSGKPGEILDQSEMIIACGGQAIQLETIQPQGKRAMDAADFARGRRLAGGEILCSKDE